MVNICACAGSRYDEKLIPFIQAGKGRRRQGKERFRLEADPPPFPPRPLPLATGRTMAWATDVVNEAGIFEASCGKR